MRDRIGGQTAAVPNTDNAKLLATATAFEPSIAELVVLRTTTLRTLVHDPILSDLVRFD